MKISLQIFWLLAYRCSYILAQESNNQSDKTLRLPTNLWPLQYVLNIIVELEPDFKFGGDVTIQVNAHISNFNDYCFLVRILVLNIDSPTTMH